MTFIIFWRELSRSPDTHAASCEAVYDGCCAARPGKPGATPNADGPWHDVQEGTPIDQSPSSTSCRPRSRLPPSAGRAVDARSEEHTSELQSLMRNSYAVFCLKKKKQKQIIKIT